MTDKQKKAFIDDLNTTKKTDEETFEYYLYWFESKNVEVVFGDDGFVVDLIDNGTELEELLRLMRLFK